MIAMSTSTSCSLPSWMVGYLFKAVALGMVGLLAYLCRTKTTDRRDPRLLGEISLIVLTMLFLSERSWKHHFVTVLLPYSYLVGEFSRTGLVRAAGPLGRFLGPDVLAHGGCVGRLGRPLCGGARPRDRPGLRIISVGRGRVVRDGGLEGVVAADGAQLARVTRNSRLDDSPVSSRVAAASRPIVAS